MRLIFPANAVVGALAYVPVVLAALGLSAAAFDERRGSLARGASVALLVAAVTSLLSRVATALLYLVPGPADIARAAGDLGSLGLLVGLVAVLAEARAARVPVFAAFAAAAMGELLGWISTSDGAATLVLALVAFVSSRALLWLGLRRARPTAPLGPTLREVFS